MGKILLITLIIFSSYANAQSNGRLLINIANKHNKNSQNNTQDPQDDVGGGSSGQGGVCTVDQDSIPLELLNSIIGGEGLRLEHNFENETLRVYGNTDLGNCLDMVNFTLTEPRDEKPYILQAKIKNDPSICDTRRCRYTVFEDGKADTKRYQPNLDGFVKCMEETSLTGGQVDPQKTHPEEINYVFKNVAKTDEVVFASMGKDNGSYKYVHKNRRDISTGNNSCYKFEDPIKGGFKVYSAVDVNKNIKESVAKDLCQESDYKKIIASLSDFEGFTVLQKALKGVVKELLIKEVKELNDDLDATDLSGLDPKRVKDLLEDFHEFVIEPKRQEIAQLQDEFKKAQGKDAKQEAFDKLKKATLEFKKFAQSPFPSNNDISKMIDLNRKVPLDNSYWTDGVMALKKTIDTVSAYQVYAKKNDAYTSVVGLQAKIKRNQQIFYKESLEDKIELVADTDLSKSRASKAKALDAKRAIQDNNRSLQALLQRKRTQLFNECCYVLDRRQLDQACLQQKYYIRTTANQCIQGHLQDISDATEEVNRLNKVNLDLISSFEAEASHWEKVEKVRDKNYVVDITEDNEEEQPEPTSYNFDPTRFANQSRAQNASNAMSSMLGVAGQVLNPWMQQQMMMRSQNPNMFSPYNQFGNPQQYYGNSWSRGPAMMGNQFQGMPSQPGMMGQQYPMMNQMYQNPNMGLNNGIYNFNFR